ncbi:MAG TPA: VWA domain-containing protein [Vicinamibacterales bacterium]|nr:VWA domain-containing protein [Vicinamibacterales bacterium]
MRKSIVAGALCAAAAAVLTAQEKPPVQNPPSGKPEGVLIAPQAPREIIRRSVDLVTNTVIVRDEKGQFVANLGKNDFDVFEDGVKQDLITFVLTHGGRVLNDVSAPPPPVQEGILLPPPRPTNDASGRIFMIFVDDLHMDFRNTGRIRDLFKKISKELVHDGDMFGIVSTGPSSIAIDMTYDRKRLDEAINKISGAGLKPDEIISTPDGSQGPPEVRYRAHVAFSTAYEILQKLEQVHNRRKAFIYVSNGYDFDPFSKSRAKETNQRYSSMMGTQNSDGTASDSGQTSDTNPFSKSGNEFAAADLASELSELTREANRANTAMYTIDPRGLAGGPDLDETKLDMMDWQDHIRETQSSLRVIAELTGGFAVVNQNDFDKALKRIDGETSDYYVLGYYSSNPDPLKKRRNIEIKVKTPGKYDLNYKPSYVLKPAPAVKSGSR